MLERISAAIEAAEPVTNSAMPQIIAASDIPFGCDLMMYYIAGYNYTHKVACDNYSDCYPYILL